jgi:hypothetical protein
MFWTVVLSSRARRQGDSYHARQPFHATDSSVKGRDLSISVQRYDKILTQISQVRC